MRKCFTLIELLIVIAIIGILVTLLLPSLAKARYQSRIAVCASNLSQSGKATALYGSNNNNKIPPIYDDWKPWITYSIRETADFNGEGKFLELGYTDKFTHFCPQFEANGYHDKKSKKNLYNYSFENGNFKTSSGRIRTSYQYAVFNISKDERNKLFMSQLKSDSILKMDIGLTQTRTGHRSYTPGWNILKPDGSVRFKKSKEVWNLIQYNWGQDWSFYSNNLEKTLLK